MKGTTKITKITKSASSRKILPAGAFTREVKGVVGIILWMFVSFVIFVVPTAFSRFIGDSSRLRRSIHTRKLTTHAHSSGRANMPRPPAYQQEKRRRGSRSDSGSVWPGDSASFQPARSPAHTGRRTGQPVPASFVARWRRKYFFHKWFKQSDSKPAVGGLTIIYPF